MVFLVKCTVVCHILGHGCFELENNVRALTGVKRRLHFSASALENKELRFFGLIKCLKSLILRRSGH